MKFFKVLDGFQEHRIANGIRGGIRDRFFVREELAEHNSEMHNPCCCVYHCSKRGIVCLRSGIKNSSVVFFVAIVVVVRRATLPVSYLLSEAFPPDRSYAFF